MQQADEATQGEPHRANVIARRLRSRPTKQPRANRTAPTTSYSEREIAPSKPPAEPTADEPRHVTIPRSAQRDEAISCRVAHKRPERSTSFRHMSDASAGWYNTDPHRP